MDLYLLRCFDILFKSSFKNPLLSEVVLANFETSGPKYLMEYNCTNL